MGNTIRLVSGLLLIGASTLFLFSSPRMREARVSERFARIVEGSNPKWSLPGISVVVYVHDVASCKTMTILQRVADIGDEHSTVQFLGMVGDAVSEQDVAHFKLDPIVRLRLVRREGAHGTHLDASAVGTTAVIVDGKVTKTFTLRSAKDLADLSRYVDAM